MTNEQLLVDTWRQLPKERQTQVLEFAAYLRDRPVQDRPEALPTQRRFPLPEMAGKVQIVGDIVSPIVDEEDWECLK